MTNDEPFQRSFLLLSESDNVKLLHVTQKNVISSFCVLTFYDEMFQNEINKSFLQNHTY